MGKHLYICHDCLKKKGEDYIRENQKTLERKTMKNYLEGKHLCSICGCKIRLNRVKEINLN